MTIHRNFSQCQIYWLSRADPSTDAAEISRVASDVLRIAGDVVNTTKEGSVQQRGDEYGGWLETKGQNDVVHCSWNKDTNSPAGVVSFMVYPRRDYLELLKPGDVLLVFMSAQKAEKQKDFTLVTMAIIDRVAENRTVDGNGATLSTVQVSARDMGKILSETETCFDPSFAYHDQQFFTDEFFTKINDLPPGFSPVEMVLYILDLYFNVKATKNKLVEIQWRFPGSDTVGLINFLDVKNFVQTPMFGFTDEVVLPVSQGGSVWSLMQSRANLAFNEMFIDVRDVTPEEIEFREHQETIASAFVVPTDTERQRALKEQVHGAFQPSPIVEADDSRGTRSVVALVMRQQPYDTNAFYKLPVYHVNETEVFETSFGKASHEVYNYIRVRLNTLKAEDQEFSYGIKVNPGSVKAFGLKRLEAETLYAFPSAQMGADYHRGHTLIDGDFFIDMYDYYVGLLSVWHAWNDLLLAGSISMIFRPQIRVGCRLEYTYTDHHGHPDRIDFYIQAVNHNFAYDAGASRTNLTLVRGVRAPYGERRVKIPTSHLRWTEEGCALPKQFNPWARFSATGAFELDGDRVESAIVGEE